MSPADRGALVACGVVALGAAVGLAASLLGWAAYEAVCFGVVAAGAAALVAVTLGDA